MDRIERLKASYQRLLESGKITEEKYNELIEKLGA